MQVNNFCDASRHLVFGDVNDDDYLSIVRWERVQVTREMPIRTRVCCMEFKIITKEKNTREMMFPSGT